MSTFLNLLIATKLPKISVSWHKFSLFICKANCSSMSNKNPRLFSASSSQILSCVWTLRHSNNISFLKQESKTLSYSKVTHCSSPYAGPLLTTSLTTIAGSPEVKWGLSRPPEIAMPNPKLAAWKRVTQLEQSRGNMMSINKKEGRKGTREGRRERGRKHSSRYIWSCR